MPRRRNIQTDVQTANSKSLAENQRNLRTFAQLQVSNCTANNGGPWVKPEKPGSLFQTHRKSEPDVHRSEIIHARRLFETPTGLRGHGTHEEIRDFSIELAKETGYNLIDESKDSRVVLLSRLERPLKFGDG